MMKMYTNEELKEELEQREQRQNVDDDDPAVSEASSINDRLMETRLE